MSLTRFWDVTSCSMVDINRRFGRLLSIFRLGIILLWRVIQSLTPKIYRYIFTYRYIFARLYPVTSRKTVSLHEASHTVWINLKFSVWSFISFSWPITLNAETIYASETSVTSNQTRQKVKIYYDTLSSNITTFLFFCRVYFRESVVECFPAAYLKAIHAARWCQQPAIQTNVNACPNT